MAIGKKFYKNELSGKWPGCTELLFLLRIRCNQGMNKRLADKKQIFHWPLRHVGQLGKNPGK